LRELRERAQREAAALTPAELVAALSIIKDRARRMSGVSRTNPHQWMEDKSELVRDLALLEDVVRKGEPMPDRLKS
jgi:hypothetical protein